MTPFRPCTPSLCLLVLLSLSCCPQLSTSQSSSSTTIGWRDDYRLDFSYDDLSSTGPSNWNDVTSSVGWGEWEMVRLSSAEADANEDGLPLLDWDSDTNLCGSEARPSPIELIPSTDCTDTEEIKTRIFLPDVDCQHPVEKTDRQEGDESSEGWEITPYSLRYYYARTDKPCRRPTVRLSGIKPKDKRDDEEHFVLLWLEVHARSEHVIDGRRYDAELQMVHIATSRPNELVVISVLIQATSYEDNVDFQSYLLDGWQRKANLETNECNVRRELTRERPHLRGQRRANGGFATVLQDYSRGHHYNASFYNDRKEPQPVARNLQGGGRCSPDQYGNGCEAEGMAPRKRYFPYNLWPSMWYFSYEGSITAPPCQGSVHWRIIDVPLSISRRQYKQLTRLLTQSRDTSCRFDTATNLQGENFRPLQNATMSADQLQDDLGPQTVRHCTADNFVVSVYREDEQ